MLGSLLLLGGAFFAVTVVVGTVASFFTKRKVSSSIQEPVVPVDEEEDTDNRDLQREQQEEPIDEEENINYIDRIKDNRFDKKKLMELLKEKSLSDDDKKIVSIAVARQWVALTRTPSAPNFSDYVKSSAFSRLIDNTIKKISFFNENKDKINDEKDGSLKFVESMKQKYKERIYEQYKESVDDYKAALSKDIFVVGGTIDNANSLKDLNELYGAMDKKLAQFEVVLKEKVDSSTFEEKMNGVNINIASLKNIINNISVSTGHEDLSTIRAEVENLKKELEGLKGKVGDDFVNAIVAKLVANDVFNQKIEAGISAIIQNQIEEIMEHKTKTITNSIKASINAYIENYMNEEVGKGLLDEYLNYDSFIDDVVNNVISKMKVDLKKKK